MKGQISYDMRQEDQSPHPDERVCFLIDKEVKELSLLKMRI